MDWTDREMELNPTMTITDLCEFFKANCIPAAPDTMGRYITEGSSLCGGAGRQRRRQTKTELYYFQGGRLRLAGCQAAPRKH